MIPNVSKKKIGTQFNNNIHTEVNKNPYKKDFETIKWKKNLGKNNIQTFHSEI